MPKFFIKGIEIGDFKGVLFDKDGTLSNSEPYLIKISNLRIKKSIEKLKQDLCKEDINKFNTIIKTVYGLENNHLNPNSSIAIASKHENLISTATIFSLLGMDWSRSITLAKEIFIQADQENAIDQKGNHQRSLLPGSQKMLKKLKKAQIKCAIISNDTKEGIKDFLILNNLDTQFTAYCSSDDYPSKPDPNAVKKLCQKINLDPSECVLIGDSEIDMQMAKKAKIGFAIGYVAGWSIKPKLSSQNQIIFNWDDISCI